MCSWALNSTRFVAALAYSKDSTVAELDQLVTGIGRYLADNPPPVSSDVLDMCVQLNNTRLLRQCSAADAKCRDALHLMHTRRVRTFTFGFTIIQVELRVKVRVRQL